MRVDGRVCARVKDEKGGVYLFALPIETTFNDFYDWAVVAFTTHGLPTYVLIEWNV